MTLDTLLDVWNGIRNTSNLIKDVEELHAGKNQHISRYNTSDDYQLRRELYEPLITERTHNNTKNLPYAVGRTLVLLANLPSPRTGKIAEEMLRTHHNKPLAAPDVTPGDGSIASKILYTKALQHARSDSTQIKDYTEKDYHELPVHPAAR